MKSFSTGAAGSYNVSSTPVSVPATYSALDVTPAGSVEITAGTAAAASYDKTTSVAISSAAPVDGVSVANYTPAGDVTVSNVTVTPSTASVATVTDSGTAYQLSAGSMSQAADTTSAFATEGVVASIGTGAEAETLILTAASTSNAVTASGAVTYTDPTLSGSLPTFGSETVVTGITSASATASFSGAGTVLSANPSYTATAATMTQPTFTAEFTGTSKSVTPSVATTVSAAGTDGSITVASETITPSATSTEKTVSVTFGNNA
jgi:S-DNA-T family DNA segregation ATPase FtsK/SpoIIIE